MMSEIWEPCWRRLRLPARRLRLRLLLNVTQPCGALVGVDVVYRCGWTPRGKINLPSIHRHDCSHRGMVGRSAARADA